MSDVRVRGRAGPSSMVWLAATLFIAAVAAPAFAAEPIAVQLDRARIIKLPERAATVVIGDPLIADLSLQPDRLAVITGKGYGATNVIVLDKDGAVLAEHTIEVKGPADPTVVVYRGVARQTYSCTPECLPRITLGDDADYFGKTLDQSSTRNTQAMAAGSKSGPGGGDGNNNNGAVNAPATSSSQNGVTITVHGNNGPQNPADRH